MDTPGLLIVVILAALAAVLGVRSQERSRRMPDESKHRADESGASSGQSDNSEDLSDARAVRRWTWSVTGVGLCAAIVAEAMLPFDPGLPFRVFYLAIAVTILLAYWAGRARARAFGRDRYMRIVSHLRQHGDFFDRHFWIFHLAVAAAVILILSAPK